MSTPTSTAPPSSSSHSSSNPPPSSNTAMRPRLTRASTTSTVDLRSARTGIPIAPLSPHIPYSPPSHQQQQQQQQQQAARGATGRPLQHRKTLSSAADALPTMAALSAAHPPSSSVGWGSKPSLGRMTSIPSLPSSAGSTPAAQTTPPISPRGGGPFFPTPPTRPTPLNTPPHSQSPPILPPGPGSPAPLQPAPPPPVQQQGPPRSGALHPTKFQEHYAVSIYLPNFSPDWITIAQRKGNSLLIVGDNYEESDGHYEWQIPFGPDARMDTLRAKFNNEHLEITVVRGPPPTVTAGMVMAIGAGAQGTQGLGLAGGRR